MNLSPDKLAALDEDIRRAVIDGPLDWKKADDLAGRYDLSRRAVLAHAARDLGLPLGPMSPQTEDDEDEEEDDSASRYRTPAHDNEYGVLQGPANLVGLLFRLFGIAILLFALVGLYLLVTGQLSD
jgi:hypothetical protein